LAQIVKDRSFRDGQLAANSLNPIAADYNCCWAKNRFPCSIDKLCRPQDHHPRRGRLRRQKGEPN
jgi:hypothetical protein